MLFDSLGVFTGAYEDANKEANAFITEMMMLDSLDDIELESFLSDREEVGTAVTEGVLLEKSIVRLDKKAKLTKAQRMAVFTIAREKNDPKFKKLLTVWRMERQLEAYLNKKYGNEALRRAKKSVQAAANSKSVMVKKAANKAKKQLNGSVKVK